MSHININVKMVDKALPESTQKSPFIRCQLGILTTLTWLAFIAKYARISVWCSSLSNDALHAHLVELVLEDKILCKKAEQSLVLLYENKHIGLETPESLLQA